MIDRFDVLIVGTGHGGAQTALALRQNGFEGTIAMLGRDKEPPYERPPLSKEYLAREKEFERILIRPVSFWKDKQVRLMLGSEVVAVDADARTVALQDGRTFGYGELVWDAGGSPRKLTCEGADLQGIHSVRDKGDVDAITGQLGNGARRVVVIGGGVVGFNAAQMAVGLGADVTILDRDPEVLEKVGTHFEARASTRFSNAANLYDAVTNADLVIGAVLIPGAAAPKLVTRDTLRDMQKGAVLVDVAIDQGGCFETSRATTHAEPTYVIDDVVHYCVANMPGAVARTSTYALNNVTLPHALQIADHPAPERRVRHQRGEAQNTARARIGDDAPDLGAGQQAD